MTPPLGKVVECCSLDDESPITESITSFYTSKECFKRFINVFRRILIYYAEIQFDDFIAKSSFTSTCKLEGF